MAPLTSLRLPNNDPAQLRQALLADRAATLTRLYQQAFPLVRRLVRRQGGSTADAKDVFQDALVIFYEQAVDGSLTLTAAASTYLVGISQNLWRHELRRRQRHTDLNDAHTELPDADTAAEPEASALVLSYLEQLGERCRSILLSFYYFQQPLEQIAATHQYNSVRSATVQKFKCLERLRQVVRAVAHAFAH